MARGLMLLSFILGFASVAFAQEFSSMQTAAPPPMKFVSKDDRSQLEAEKDIKKRTRLTVELAEAKLLRAQQLTDSEDFSAVITELGCYQGLVENALAFLSSFPSSKDKTRDTYKKLEISLRAHIVRIEAIRRMTPAEYADNFKTTIEFIRDARDKALNAFYDDTVIPDKDKKANGEKAESAKKQPEGATTTQKPSDKP